MWKQQYAASIASSQLLDKKKWKKIEVSSRTRCGTGQIGSDVEVKGILGQGFL